MKVSSVSLDGHRTVQFENRSLDSAVIVETDAAVLDAVTFVDALVAEVEFTCRDHQFVRRIYHY